MKAKVLASDTNWVVYILRCRDNTLYTGITNNIEKRLIAHNKGTASRYTRARLPVKLLISSRGMSKQEALRLEIKIKKQPREEKLKVLTAIHTLSLSKDNEAARRRRRGVCFDTLRKPTTKTTKLAKESKRVES